MSAPLTRRELLRLAAALAAALAAPRRASAQMIDPLLELLLAVRVDPEHLALYAEGYLLAHPEERQPAVLIAGFARLEQEARGADFRQTVRGRIRRDFAEGRTVNLDGWILSVTEVRLWCLIHLLAD